MQRYRRIIGIALCALLCACDSTWQSSVPAYPVNIVIDTRVGQFVHFQPTSLNSNVVVNRDGYFLDGNYVLPTAATDAWGYGGVVVFVSIYGYDAYDLACPYCASRGLRKSCIIDGMYAECPHCGEAYDLSSGTGAAQKGMIRETLRRLNLINNDGRLTISQR